MNDDGKSNLSGLEEEIQKARENAFVIDKAKIMSIDARDYFSMHDKKPSNFVPVGVFGRAENLYVLEGTEVVVKYDMKHTGYGNGTALIPADKLEL